MVVVNGHNGDCKAQSNKINVDSAAGTLANNKVAISSSEMKNTDDCIFLFSFL